MSLVELSLTWNSIHFSLKFIDEQRKCINKYMNVCLNGNLAQMPGIHFDVLLTPKKKAALPFASKLFCLISDIAVYCFTRL